MMRKLVKNWVFLSAILLFVVCGAFYCYMLVDVSSQPSKRWSKGLLLEEVSYEKVSESARIRIVTVPNESNGSAIVLWNEKNALKLVTVDEHGTIKETQRINVKLGEPVKMNAFLSNRTLTLFLLESGVLRKYQYNLVRKVLSFEGIVSESVNDFLCKNGSLLIATDNNISIMDKNGIQRVIHKQGAQLLSVFFELDKNKQELIHIASTRSDGKGLLFINYTQYSPTAHKSDTHIIGKQFMGNNEMGDFDNLLISTTGNTMNIMASRKFQIPSDTCRRLPRSTNNRIMLYSFDKKSIPMANVKTSLINEITSVEPNLTLNYSNGKSFGFICSTTIPKGRKSYSINLMQYGFENGVARAKEQLTNTQEISREPSWYQLNGKDYLQWEDRTGTSTRIMLAGTDPEMITKAGRLSAKTVWITFLDALMPLGFSLSYLFLIFSCIMLPTLVFVSIAAVFFMNWTERYSKHATRLACGIHVFAGIGMILLFDIRNTEVSSIEPMMLQNPFGKLMLVLFLAAMSYTCMRLRFREEKYDKSFINQYLFFSVHNMILLALLIFPYYYI